jgi:outer membrane lipoprotein-sorting protein
MMLLALISSLAAAGAPSAQAIVRAADEVRNPHRAFRSRLTLSQFVSGKEQDRTVLVVHSKEDPATGQFRNLVRYVDPPRDAGKAVLLSGHTLWFFDPASNASVRISPQQRLLGQAAIGDVLTVNLAVDYAASLEGPETIHDAQRQPRPAWHVVLKPANDQATYGRVDYWVDRESSQPLKAKVWSDSGRLLKVLYYRAFVRRLEAVRPAEVVIIDSVDASLVTTARFDEDRWEDIPESWFQRESLSRVPAE